MVDGGISLAIVLLHLIPLNNQLRSFTHPDEILIRDEFDPISWANSQIERPRHVDFEIAFIKSGSIFDEVVSKANGGLLIGPT